jgi:hypothetical protein
MVPVHRCLSLEDLLHCIPPVLSYPIVWILVPQVHSEDHNEAARKSDQDSIVINCEAVGTIIVACVGEVEAKSCDSDLDIVVLALFSSVNRRFRYLW